MENLLPGNNPALNAVEALAREQYVNSHVENVWRGLRIQRITANLLFVASGLNLQSTLEQSGANPILSAGAGSALIGGLLLAEEFGGRAFLKHQAGKRYDHGQREGVSDTSTE